MELRFTFVVVSFLFLITIHHTCVAHVKLFYEPLRAPIRNAPGPTSDGVFSVAGACGGSDRWGNRGFKEFRDGQNICLRANFNGGHQNLPANKFRALLVCNRPDRQNLFTQLNQGQRVEYLAFTNNSDPQPTEGGYRIPALLANAKWDDYTACFDLPDKGFVNSTTPDYAGERLCTISLLDERNWGGCIDIAIMDATWGGYVTAAPTLSAVQNAQRVTDLTIAEGTYQISNCDGASGGMCCLEGFIGVKRNGWVSGRIQGTSPNACGKVNYDGWLVFQTIVFPSKWGTDLYQGNILLDMGQNPFGIDYGIQNISIIIREGGSIELVNVGLTVPYILNHNALRYTSLTEGVGLGIVPEPLGYMPYEMPSSIIIMIVCLGLFCIYFFGGIWFNRFHGDGYWSHPHIYGCLIGFNLAKKRKSRLPDVDPNALKTSKGFYVTLPIGWSAAVDPGRWKMLCGLCVRINDDLL